jgi:serine/threonine protein kinase/Flp pilus assembly protein TadD
VTCIAHRGSIGRPLPGALLMSDGPTQSLPPVGDPSAIPSQDGSARGADDATVGPADALTDAGPPIAPPGYELLEEVGRGGMGVVYRARELTLNRDIALKILRDRYPANSTVARRFVEEAAITGQLQHPGIPPVHHVGTLPDGRPFLAMKLIRGSTLEDLLKGRKTPAEDRGRLLAVFEQVCQAVGYAHAHHVIHRDLKPANVMVGNYGEVQVMDWGLAKTLTGERPASHSSPTEVDETLGTEIRSVRDLDSHTQAGSILGTPAFMPPEQAGGEIGRIDARSDVFGLGAVLSVILTGQPPYAGKDSEAVRLMAIRGQLAECLARLDDCGAEPGLVALCKRCLAMEPADRPVDAGEVAKAVAGLRAESEERAKRAEIERARAEVAAAEQRKRRKMQAALGLAFTALLVLGCAFAWWQDRQTTIRQVEAENRERAELDRRDRNAAAAEALLGQCEDALRADNAATAGLLLEQTERQAAEGGADELADRLARCRADLDLLHGLDRIDALRWAVVEGQFQGDKALQALPEVLGLYGIVPGSTPPEAAARRVRDSLVRDRLLTALDLWLSSSRSTDVAAILRLADPDQYRTDVREAIRAGGPGVARLALQPEALDQPARFAVVLGSSGTVAVGRRRAILCAVLQRRPADFGVLMTLGSLHAINSAATADAREMWYRAALAVRPGSVAALNGLGIALLDNGDREGAADAFREAIRLDPKYPHAHNNLGSALNSAGNRDRAIAAFREAARFETKSPIPHLNLGNVLQAAGDLDGALAAYRKAIAIDPKSEAGRRALMTLHLLTGEFDRAESLIREFLAEQRTRLGPDTVNYSHPLAEWGERLVEHGRLAAAEPILRECWAIREKQTPDTWGTFYTTSYLGLALAGQGKEAEAEQLLVKGYEGLMRVGVPTPWQAKLPGHLRSVTEQLVRHYETVGKPEEAKRWRAEMAKHPVVAPPPRAIKR